MQTAFDQSPIPKDITHLQIENKSSQELGIQIETKRYDMLLVGNHIDFQMYFVTTKRKLNLMCQFYLNKMQ